MKRIFLSVAVICLLANIFMPVVLAYSSTPTDDAWVDASTTSFNTTSLIIQSSTPCAVTGATSWGYLKWDLNTITKQIGTANVSFVVSSVPTLGSQASTLSLVAVSDDAWNETNVGSVKPALGSTLSSVTFDPSNPPTQGSTLAFPSTPELLTFLNQQVANDPVGQKYASLGLVFSACSAGAPSIRFASKTNATYAGPKMDLVDPTAVALTTLEANQPASNWPLYIGLGALALLVLGGLLVYRRRVAVR